MIIPYKGSENLMLILRLPYGNPTDCTKRVVYVYNSPEFRPERLPPNLKQCIIKVDSCSDSLGR